MKLNIANPGTGLQQTIEIDDDKKLLPFYEKRMGVEVPADSLGDKFKGYIFKITGGNDKQGFPMMQGVMTNGRVRLLFSKGMKCYRPRRTGEKKRKTVRGCIVGPDLSVIHVVVTKKGEEDIPGLTDGSVPRRLGPKRANKIRKMWNLSADDDVRKYVVRRAFTDAKGKTHSKAPKIQRLITQSRLQRKGRRRVLQRRHWESIAQQESDYKIYLDERKAAAAAASHGTPSPPAASPAASPAAAASTPAAQ